MIKTSFFSNFIFVLVFATSTSALPQPTTPPTRTTPRINSPSGNYRGKYVDLDGDNLDPVVQFLGIPYAQPPRRWELPKKRPFQQEEMDATEFRNVCPQPNPAPSPLLPIWLREKCPKIKEMMNNGMSEDCLYLNIYIPGKYFYENTTNYLSLDLPVMMYFHGHTFSDGAGSLYDGSALSSYGNVIVITFNYRLGVLGFMSSGEDWMKGNFGLYDQIRANDWVIDNIKSFGGDCDKITAFGSGAGGSSIGLLMLSPQGEAKFKRAILQSGSPLTSWAMEENPKQSFDAFVNSSSINCYSNSTAGIIKCLKDKPWKELVNAAPGLDQSSWRFGPVVDKQLLLAPPLRLMDAQEFINYEVIIGVTSDDGFGFAQSRLGLNPNETCNMMNGFSEENIYKQENFVADIVNFVSKSFGEGNYTDLIRDTIRFVYTDWKNKETKNSWMKALIDLYTDKRIVLPAIQTAEYHSQQNPTYFYTFNQNPGKSPGRNWLGAIHAEELPYIFGAPLLKNGMDLYPYKFDNDDKMLSSALITYWVNFAKNGDPNVGKEQVTDFNTGNPNLFNKVDAWPQYRNETKKYLNILYSPEVKDYYRSDKMAFWRSFVPGFKKKRLAPKSCQKPVKKGQETSTNDYYTSENGRDPQAKDTSTTNCNDSKNKTSDSLCKIVAISIAVFLFCVSAVIFALMSYQKDKHRFQLEKLRTDLKSTQKRDKNDSGSSHRTHGERDSKRKIVEEKSSSSHGKSHSKHKKSSSVALPIPSDDPAHPKTLPMKSCLKVGGSAKTGSNGMDFCKIRVSKVVTSPSTLSSQTVMGHANTLRSQMISTERFAELEGIRCITLGRRRCNSALASTLLKQNDNEHIKLQNNNQEQRKMPAPPVQFTQTPACSNDLLAYKPLDGSVRSLTLNRSNFRHGNGPYGTVQTTQRPLFQSQVMVGHPIGPVVGMDSDRKPLLCRTRAINVKEGFSTLPMAREEVVAVTTKNS